MPDLIGHLLLQLHRRIGPGGPYSRYMISRPSRVRLYCPPGRFPPGEPFAIPIRFTQGSAISEDSMRGAIALSYYFIACGIKAHRKFISSPVDELPGMQKTIYDELPQSFETRTGLLVAERYGMPERTFKRWLSTSLFRKLTHGYYEKRYR